MHRKGKQISKMEKTVNVGLIGYGMGGQLFHGPILSSVEGLKLIKIRETKAPNIAHARKKYQGVDVVSTSSSIFEDPNVELVVITSPNHTHYSLTKEALLANKHVVVDKPFTVTSQEADELIALAQKNNKILSVYHNRRFDSEYKTVKKVLDSQLLGTLVEYEVHFDRFRNFIKQDTWKEEPTPGTGLLYDLGSHLIDQALSYFGLPDTVFADIRIQRAGGKIVDNFEIILNFGELKVTLKSGMLVKEIGPRIALLGNLGTYQSYGMDVQEEALKAGLFPNDTPDWGIAPESQWGTLHTSFNELEFVGKVKSERGDYREYYENIYKVINGSETLIVKPEEARNTIKIIELAMKSNEEKRVLDFAV